MPSCDKCHKEVYTRYRVGSERLCPECYGPPMVRPEMKKEISLGPSQFIPHYNPTIRQWVYSWNDMEKKGKEFINEQHPKGLVLLQDNKTQIKEYKHIYKNREEIIQESYAKKGFRYKPGSDTRFDEKHKDFIPRRSSNRTYFFSKSRS